MDDDGDTGERVPRTLTECIEKMRDEHGHAHSTEHCWVCYWCDELERIDRAGHEKSRP